MEQLVLATSVHLYTPPPNDHQLPSQREESFANCVAPTNISQRDVGRTQDLAKIGPLRRECDVCIATDADLDAKLKTSNAFPSIKTRRYSNEPIILKLMEIPLLDKQAKRKVQINLQNLSPKKYSIFFQKRIWPNFWRVGSLIKKLKTMTHNRFLLRYPRRRVGLR